MAVAFLLTDTLLPAAPVLGIILLVIFWMIVCMLDIGGLSALTDGEAPDITPNTPMHYFAAITVNVINLLFSVGTLLFRGQSWTMTVFGLLLFGQIARIGWYLLGMLVSFLTKWTGRLFSSLCGTVAYMAGFAGYVYWLVGKYDGFTMLVYGLSQSVGGGLR